MSETLSVEDDRPGGAPVAVPAAARGWRVVANWPGWPAVVAVAPLAVVLLLQLPMVAGDEVPAADWAVLELRTRATLRAENFLGPYSRFQWSHPGPAMFLVMGPFYWLAGGRFSGLVVAVLVVHMASMGLIVASIRRAHGLGAAWVAALACLAFAWRFGLERFRDPWNPYWVVTPLAALIVVAAVAWALPGRTGRWALPVVAAVGTVLVQSHVGAAPVVAAAAAVAVAGVLAQRRREDAGPVWPAAALAVAVAGALWVPPVYEQLTRDPGNLGELVFQLRTRSGDHALSDVAELALPALSPVETHAGYRFGPSSPFRAPPSGSWVSWMLLGASAAVLVAGAAQALRRRSRAPGRAALALAPLAAVAVAVLATRRALGPLHPYLFTPVIGVSLAWWVAAGLHGAWLARRLARPGAARLARRMLPAVAVVAAGAVLLASANDLSASTRSFAERWQPLRFERLHGELARQVCPAGGDLLQLEMRGGQWIDAVAVAAALERCGRRVRFPGGLAYVVGQRATAIEGTASGYLVIRRRDDEGGPGERFLGQAGSASVWLADRPPHPE